MSLPERLPGNRAPAPVCYLADRRLPLCLAALYESWLILLSVRWLFLLGVIGALLAATFRD